MNTVAILQTKKDGKILNLKVKKSKQTRAKKNKMKKSMVTIITDASRWLRPPLDAEKEDGNEDCRGNQENKLLFNSNNRRFPKK